MTRFFGTALRTVLVCLAAGLANGANAQALLDDKIVFRTTLARGATLKINLGAWTDAERATVMALFAQLQAKAPGLLDRATAAGPISLYRTADDSPSHPAAAWARRRHETTLIFRDDFFRVGYPNGQGIEYSNWLFLHEVAHLADPVDLIGQSREWRDVIEWRIDTLKTRLKAQGFTVRQAMFKYLDKPAIALGFPSVYSAVSLHEALAEQIAGYYFNAPFEQPQDVTDFLEKRLFSKPSKNEITSSVLYKSAHMLYLDQNYSAAEAQFSDALAKNPTFGMGYYMLGYVHLYMGEFEKADEDWDKALAIIPPSDLREIDDLRKGRAYLRENLENN